MDERKEELKEDEAYVLEDLEVEEISLVDVPAQNVQIEVTKRDSEGGETETQKSNGYLEPKSVVEWLKGVCEQETDDKRKKRCNLLAANLADYFGLKKFAEELRKLAESERETAEVDKAGKAISAANAAKLKEIAAKLLEAAKAIMELIGEKPPAYGYPYGYGYGYPYYTPQPTQASAQPEKIDAPVTNVEQVKADELAVELASLLLSGKELSKEELEALETAVSILSSSKEGDNDGNGRD